MRLFIVVSHRGSIACGFFAEAPWPVEKKRVVAAIEDWGDSTAICRRSTGTGIIAVYLQLCILLNAVNKTSYVK